MFDSKIYCHNCKQYTSSILDLVSQQNSNQPIQRLLCSRCLSDDLTIPDLLDESELEDDDWIHT